MQIRKIFGTAALSWFVLVVGVQCLMAAGSSGSYRVGYFNLSGEADGENPAGFVNSLDATPGLNASLAAPALRGSSWRTPPADIAPSEWISLVKVKAGRQCDFMAFLFSDRDGSVAYAGRRPSAIPIDPPKYPLTVAPGPCQIPANAIREPATDFLYRYASELARTRTPLCIVIESSLESLVANTDGLTVESGARVISRDIAEAMAFAAAFEAGWQPVSAAQGEVKHVLRLTVIEELRLYFSVQARFDDDSAGFQRRFIPKERLYNHLVGLFFQLKNAASIIDAVPYASPGAMLLGWADDRVIIQDELAIKAVSPMSGKTLWQTTAGNREQPRYRMLPATTAGEAATLWRYDQTIRQLNLKDGSEQNLMPENVVAADGFAVAPDGRLALVSAGALMISRDRHLVWKWDGAAAHGHPIWGNDRVFVAGADGTLHAFDAEKGVARWNVSFDNVAKARLFYRQDMLLVDNGRALVALNPLNGSRLWECETGDVLLGEPVAMGKEVFAVIKPNQLRVWDLKTGAVKAAREWPTWIIAADAVPVGDTWQIACVDLRGRLGLFAASDLEPLREVTFPGPLLPKLVYGDAVPVTWSMESQEQGESWEMELAAGLQAGTVQKRPAWLVADMEGCLYAIAVAKQDVR